MLDIDYYPKILESSKLSCEKIARETSVCSRTIRDWRRGVLLPDYNKVLILSKKYKVNIPKPIEILPEHWQLKKWARRAGIIRYKKYGAPGTIEDRRKGGLISWQKRLNNPKLMNNWNKANEIQIPEKSEELAEFIGLVLGDGSLSMGQCMIYLNSQKNKDRDYVYFVSDLIKELFKLNCPITKRKDCNCYRIIISSVNLIKYLVKIGLVTGNKTKNQVKVPAWIQHRKNLSIVCLRGLMDTDGGIFLHKYKANGKEYKYFKTCFSNKSEPLLDFVRTTLSKLGFNPKIRANKQIWLYNESEVKQYFEKISSHNDRLRRVAANW